MSSEALYRSLVPAHTGVLPATIATWLALAARRLSASAFGTMYPEAAVWWAAHHIEVTPGTGATGDNMAPESPEVHKRQRKRTARRTDPRGSDEWYRSTEYGAAFLDIRDTRAAGVPTVIGPSGS